MIMDSMGALALATEKPTMLLLRLRPYGRDEQLVSGRMWLHIVGQGLYQVGLRSRFSVLS
jgi:Ca2+-transporting ATPase